MPLPCGIVQGHHHRQHALIPHSQHLGKKSTEKTEFAISLISLFQRSPEVSNLDSATYYAMGDKCAEVSNMIVHFDEYKNSLSKKHIDFLKGIYEGCG